MGTHPKLPAESNPLKPAIMSADDTHLLTSTPKGLNIERKAVSLTICAAPSFVYFHAIQGKDSFHTIRLTVTSLTIGNNGESKFPSKSASNNIFVIDRDSQRQLDLREIILMDEKIFLEEQAGLSELTGKRCSNPIYRR